MRKTVSRILNTYNANKTIVRKTLLDRNERLSSKYKCNIFLKREDLGDTRSFKLRGAYNKISKLSQEDKKRGIVCASAGNHAQGVSYSCNILGISSDIFVP